MTPSGPDYLLRFDDACPTMPHDIWAKVEEVLDHLDVRPIVAVVPDNKSPLLDVDPPDPSFWDGVRGWVRKGWTIAMHGYQHQMDTTDAGILKLNHRSEFAGLPLTVQQEKLERALEIFTQQSVAPRVWAAPAHSFDSATLVALTEIGITTVSDGLHLFPFTDENGLLWIPQQMGVPRRMPVGVWTIGLHITAWTSSDIDRFSKRLARMRSRISAYEDIKRKYGGRRRGLLDHLSGSLLRAAKKLRAASYHN